MSWSFSCIGKPSKVADAIDKASEHFSGQSLLEFDAAKPHLIALVRENFTEAGSGYSEPVIDFEASGSGSTKSGAEGGSPKQLQRQCSVSIKRLWKTLV